jgi:hypothetical protein
MYSVCEVKLQKSKYIKTEVEASKISKSYLRVLALGHFHIQKVLILRGVPYLRAVLSVHVASVRCISDER